MTLYDHTEAVEIMIRAHGNDTKAHKHTFNYSYRCESISVRVSKLTSYNVDTIIMSQSIAF